MEIKMWEQAWEDRNIGFHQSEYNKIMTEHFDKIDLKDKTILIPLAGKTSDILYFLRKGACVVAVEVVQSAVEEFFNDNKMTFEKKENLYLSNNLLFYCDDFFKAHEYINKEIDYIYDRASNVALPRELRQKYYKTISKLVHNKTDFLIISFKHNGPLDFGPPFSIPVDEIESNYRAYGIELKHEIYDEMKLKSKRYQDSGIKTVNRLKWHRSF